MFSEEALAANIGVSTPEKKTSVHTENKSEGEHDNAPELHTEENAVPDSTSIQDGGMYLQQSTGNTDINSMSKFNFIFYFIYKHKYEEEKTGNDFLDYEF